MALFFFRLTLTNVLAKLTGKTRNLRIQITIKTRDVGTLLLFIEIKTTKGKYCERVYANKSDNSDETHKFLERQKPPKLTQETEHLNSPITNKEIN